ncbi:MAG TPA: hypothetical protein QGI71_10865 [Dehalococcoidia bacterium]|nr:hypothetical protein [Dehalococcoidia bacterium]
MIGTPPSPLLDEFDGLGGGTRRVAAWLIGILLAGAIALWLVVLSASQATGEVVALPAIERGIVALTDLDALLAAQSEELAAQAAAGEPVVVGGFPIRDLAIPVSEVIAGGEFDIDLLRAALLSRSALRVHASGVAAFEGGGEITAGASMFSFGGGVKTLLEALSSDNHSTASVWLWPLGAACLALGALLLAAGSGFARFTALGMALITAAVPVAIGSLALRLVVDVAAPGGGDPIVDEFVAIARQFTALPLRNALWTLGGGAAIVVPSLVLNAVFDRSFRRTTTVSGEMDVDAAAGGR